MSYKEISLLLPQEYYEILTAELASAGYDSFWETEEALKAYVTTEDFDADFLYTLQEKYVPIFDMQYTVQSLEEKNWNAVWESSFEPVVIADRCIVRSTFHQSKQDYAYEIVITPKMSFGTGHHETTALMIENQLEINHQDKKVLDAGCGTGILAIMAAKLQAKEVMAYDTDEWAYNNCLENFALNDCKHIQLQQGTVKTCVLASDYDLILANINRNVLLEEIPFYVQHLKVAEGILLLSGFYEEDLPLIEAKAQSFGLQKVSYKSANRWVSARFEFGRS